MNQSEFSDSVRMMAFLFVLLPFPVRWDGEGTGSKNGNSFPSLLLNSRRVVAVGAGVDLTRSWPDLPSLGVQSEPARQGPRSSIFFLCRLTLTLQP